MSVQENDVANVVVNSKTLASLDMDCLSEILDWLTLVDLLAISRTCRRFQWAAGNFFQTNYSSLQVKATPDGVSVWNIDRDLQINDFYYFIKNVRFPMASLPNYQLHSFQHFKTHRNESLKKMYFCMFPLSSMDIDRFKDQLKSVETLTIEYDDINQEIYEKIRSTCVNLKRLCLRNVKINGNEGTLKKFKELDHLEWYVRPAFLNSYIRNTFEIPLLRTFLAQNTSIRSFATTVDCLWENRYIIIKSNIKLDVLNIEFEYGEHRNLDYLYRFLNECYECYGVYKSLQLTIMYVDQQIIDQLKMLYSLKHLKFDYTTDLRNVDVSGLTNLTEISIGNMGKLADIYGLTTKLINLEKIYSEKATSDEIRLFVRHSKKLNTIQVKYLTQGGITLDASIFNGNILDVKTLNKERNQLNGARKLRIFISDKIFVATKYAISQTNSFNLIEIRRVES